MFRVKYGVCDVVVIYMINTHDMMHIYENKYHDINLPPLDCQITLIYWRPWWQRRHSCDIIQNYRCMRDELRIYVI